jgi:hypothetical protein
LRARQDELYALVMKQTRSCPDAKQLVRGWELFAIVSATVPPSRDFQPAVTEYVHAAVHDVCTPPEALALALRAWAALKRVTKAGPRRAVPGADELDALRKGATLSAIVYFLDETFEELAYDPTITVLEAVETLAKTLGLANHATFSLFEHRKLAPAAKAAAAAAAADAAAASDSKAAAAAAAAAPEVEMFPLEDNAYVADVLQDFRAAKAERKDGWQLRLLFKKKMFRESDDAISEPAFIKLCYIQATSDYLAGNYPVGKEDAAQMAALQAQADAGAGLDAAGIGALLERLMPRPLLATRPREEWAGDVVARYAALSSLGREDARAGLLRIVRGLPYGNSVFFTVRRMEDPIGLLPGRTLLGINKRGIHFFRPVPKEYLHSAELRDIMQFGSSASAVFFKMRVAGTLHVFQFETRQGEDICVALQTHINDIMMRRYQKQQRIAAATPGGSAAAAASAATPPSTPLPAQPGTPGSAPATPGSGARASQSEAANRDLIAIYDRRAAELTASLAEAQRKLDEECAARATLAADKRAVDEALAEARDALAAATAARVEAADAVEVAQREADAARAALAAVSASASADEPEEEEAAPLPAAAAAAPAAATPPPAAATPGGASRLAPAASAPAGSSARKAPSPAARTSISRIGSSVGASATGGGDAGFKTAQLTTQVKDLQKELAAATEKARAAERARAAAVKERELAVAKVERLEKTAAGDKERTTRDAAKDGADARAKIERLEKRVAELTAELASVTAALAAKSDEAAELEGQLNELEELRELKADVDRKDAQTGAILKGQREAIEQLEQKYKCARRARAGGMLLACLVGCVRVVHGRC